MGRKSTKSVKNAGVQRETGGVHHQGEVSTREERSKKRAAAKRQLERSVDTVEERLSESQLNLKMQKMEEEQTQLRQQLKRAEERAAEAEKCLEHERILRSLAPASQDIEEVIHDFSMIPSFLIFANCSQF
jgi:predicted  nucleic acid-binding Zn-ribbon protein